MCILNSFKNKPLIVFGAGSIGERYIRNLWKLGFEQIYVFRHRGLPFRDIGDARVIVINNLNDLAGIKPLAAFVTTPTSLHIAQVIECVRSGISVMVEKPLASNLDRLDELIVVLKENQVFLHVGYMMRFHPLIKKIKEYIQSGTFGNLISLQSKWGEYLPDWHPWEDYRESYAARKELGGGVALTLSHDIDIANYLADSEIDEYYSTKNHRSMLETDVEAGADILIKYKNGVTANIHLNFYERCPERFLKLIFDEASISFDYYDASLTIKKPNTAFEINKIPDFDRNELFVEQTMFFLSKLNNFTIDESIKQVKNSETIINICNK